MDHSIIPQEWKKFLATVQQFFPSAIIAGGALRDLITEKPIKDVDIFIHDPELQSDIRDSGLLEKLADALGIMLIGEDEKTDRDFIRIDNDFKAIKAGFAEEVIQAGGIDSEYLDSDCDRSVYEAFMNYIVTIKYNSVLYQLILIETEPKSYVYNDFDFGICKVFFDGNKLTPTEEFWYDLEHRQITFAGKFSVGQAIHTLFTHRENIIKKYPGWKVVIDDLRKREPHEMPPSYQEAMRTAKEIIEQEKANNKVTVTFKSEPVPMSSVFDEEEEKLMHEVMMKDLNDRMAQRQLDYEKELRAKAKAAWMPSSVMIKPHPASATDWGDIRIDTSMLSKQEIMKLYGYGETEDCDKDGDDWMAYILNPDDK